MLGQCDGRPSISCCRDHSSGQVGETGNAHAVREPAIAWAAEAVAVFRYEGLLHQSDASIIEDPHAVVLVGPNDIDRIHAVRPCGRSFIEF
jgi:hypothetical protein